jgi:ABC-type Fe3+-hydroxamate transport system substrate-binding protein
MTVNFDTYVDSICSLFGFDNVFRQNQERYPRITDDEIVKADPDLLLFPDEPFPFRPRHREQFCLKFPGLLAVRANRILSFDGSYTTWHGVGMLRALREFPDALHKAGLWL